MLPRLNETTLLDAAHRLASIEPFFQGVLERIGPPPLWSRPPGFATLVWIILEQQVSLASARAAYRRLEARLTRVEPQAFLSLNDEELKAIGFSRQKTAYSRGLAQAILNGEIDFDQMEIEEDDQVRRLLTRLKGIGAWTADIYLMEALGRADIWPVQDRGLVVAIQNGLKLVDTPMADQVLQIGEPWRPYRSVAARFFWHYYLSELRPPKTAALPFLPEGVT